MDFRNAITNPAAGHSPAVDDKAQQWGGVEGDILHYLSDVRQLEEFANRAHDAEQLAEFVQPFLENAQTYFEAMQKVADGQLQWTDLRAKFGVKTANVIQRIREINGNFAAELERVDAKDHAALTKIEQKRQHGLQEIATQLAQDLELQAWKHSQNLAGIDRRAAMASERQAISAQIREQRQLLMGRVKHGARALSPSTEPVLQIPVNVNQGRYASSISASGSARGFLGGLGSTLRNFWQGMKG